MKLSVKLITALAAFVLLVVGFVGLTSSGSTASAAVDANVHVANEWSNLTNDPTPMTGYTFAGSGKSIFSTFVEVDDATGVAQSTIAGTGDNNANRVTIFVEDADVNVSVAKSATVPGGAVVGGGGGAGTTQVVVLLTADSPIVDANSNGNLAEDVTVTGTGSGLVTVSAATAGSSTVPATVTIVQTTGTAPGAGAVVLNWNTSAVDTVTVKVTSTQNSTGKTFSISETGASTGVFKGTVDLIDVQRAATPATDPNAVPTTTANGGTIAIQNGGTLTVEYSDTTPASGGSAKAVKSTAIAETGAPLVTVTAPASGSATQVRRPSFAGTVSDTTSGLDISEAAVFIDTSTDPTNTTVVSAGKGSTTDKNSPTLPAGAADGVTSTTFSLTPAADLPNAGVTTPDHIVDWQVQATDLAGNIGWSDSNTTTANTAGRGQAHTVKIDRTLPGIDEAYTGFVLDNTVNPIVRKTDNKKSIEVNFNDSMDGITIQNTDFEVVTGSVTQVPTAATVGGTGFTDRVFLTLAGDLKSDDIPTVRIVGSVADAAGNTTSTGSKVGKDALAPTITVALSGGSSATSPATLTKDKITITITSDENLSADPTVEIFNEGVTGAAEGTVAAVNQGSNTWVASFNGASFDGATADGKKKSVRVTASDSASTVAQVGATVDSDTTVPTGVTVGVSVKGKTDTAASGATVFSLDKTAPTLTLSPTTDTSDNSPFVRWDFGEVVTVSLAEFGVDGSTLADVTSELGTSDNKVFIRATSNLALATYKATGTVTDLAGNKATGLSGTFKVIKRDEFKLTLLPGTTLVSFPLTPSDTSINSVFSPDGIVSVSSYNATTGQFVNAVRSTAGGGLQGDLASISSGVGYIVVADAVSALVVPIPSLSASSIPPNINLASGWNLVGVTDVTGDATGKLRQPGSTIGATRGTYFPAKVTQVYDWDATAKVWKQVATGTLVEVGDAYWAFATAADVIVP